MNNRAGSTEKLEALLKRQAAVAAALRTERDKRKAIAQRDQDRLTLIVGRALLVNAAQSPDFELMLKGILRNAGLSESDRKFLQSRNWL